MRFVINGLLFGLLVAGLTGCSSMGPQENPANIPPALIQPGPTVDAATRTAPFVPGRPGRVFVFAGVGTACEPLAPPELTIIDKPQKGEVSFVPNQETAIAASAQGTCAGQKSTGTGVYYTARVGSAGTDRFSISAKLSSGETMTRSFEVRIEE